MFHLFRLAKYAYDANPCILKWRIKEGSKHICKTVYDSVFGSIFVKGVEELHALQIYYETKRNYSQLIVTPNSTNGEKQDTAKDACLQIYHRTWQLKDQTIIRHEQWEH